MLAARPYPANVPLDPWSRVRVAAFAGGTLLVLRALAADPAWVEASFVEGFGGTITAWSGWLTGAVPVALAEIAVVGLVLLELLRLFETLAATAGRRRSVGNAVLGGLLHLIDVALVLGLWFTVAWGLAYERVPAAERFAFPEEPPAADRDTLRRLVTVASERTNEAYRAIHGSADAGKVTVPRDGLDVDAALEQAFAELAAREGLPASFAEPRPAAKEPYLSVVLSYLGVAGIYVPFTGEALVNGGPPAWSKIHTRAHEKAHQRLVASEDEASFVGFLACVGSEEPLLRYAGWQFARRSLLVRLAAVDPDARDFAAGLLDGGPQQDLLQVARFWEPYQTPVADVGEAVNDAYLKSQGVEDGVQAYARASVLVAAWMEREAAR